MPVARRLDSRWVDLASTAWGLAALALAAFYLHRAEVRLPFHLAARGTPIVWAAATSPVRPGDVVVAVDGTSLAELDRCRACDPFRPLRAGRAVELLVERNGERRVIEVSPRAWRVTLPLVLFALASFVFWLAGMLALVWLRPRNEGWLVLVACFLTAPLWIAAGGASGSQPDLARVVFHLVHWPFWALVVHLHLVLPEPLPEPRHRRLVGGLWAATGVATLLDAAALLPRGSMILWLVLAIVAAAALLLARLLRPARPRLRLASRIMAYGVVFGLVPVAASLAFLSPVVQATFRSTLALYFAFGFLPLWPLAYLYAIHRHDLGALTSRANRAAGLYAFVALYALAFGLALLPLQMAPRVIGDLGRTVATFAVTLAFVIAASSARDRFQRFIDHVVFGIRYDPEDLVTRLALRVPTALDRPALRRIVIEEVLPSFFVRQSALVLDDAGPLVEEGLGDEERPVAGVDLGPARAAAGSFIRLQEALAPPLGWVRLALPLGAPGHEVGLWLFGRKDPDDFYCRSEIAALSALANQIAPVLENFRLLAAAQAELEERRRLQLELEHAQRVETLGRFSAAIAHDFNNLLSIVLGHCSLLLARYPNDTALRRGLVEVQTAGRRATDLTRQLLDFNRRSVGESRVVDAGAVIEDLARMFRPWVGEGVELELRSAPDLPPVDIDPGRLGQVMVNLVANARDAMPAGGKLLIETAAVTVAGGVAEENRPPAGTYVRLTVADEGVGIAPEVRSRIFDPFFTTKESGRGTGLGLSIVQGFVKQSRGYVLVDSEVGRGTRFDMFFPTASVPAPG